MALMNCPECGNEVSDKADCCPKCGYPISKYLEERIKAEKVREIYFCKSCGFQNEIGEDYCENCGMRLTDYTVVAPKAEKQEFNGIYRYTVFSGKQEVYCPRCGSADCSHYSEQKYYEGKVKTRYTMNLNPLRPFTLFNKKEKVIVEPHVDNKIICNSCGKIFR